MRRGWLQPIHAAGPYTPAYEDFYFNVSSGVHAGFPREGGRLVLPALFRVPDAAAWVLVTDPAPMSLCGCHLGPDSADGLYRVAFPLSDQTTKLDQQIRPEPRIFASLDHAVARDGCSENQQVIFDVQPDHRPWPASQIADSSWNPAGARVPGDGGLS